jgi:hypothetical protein
VRYLNAKTLADVTDQQDLAGRAGAALWGSPDGRSYALGGRHADGRGFVHVIWGGHPRVTALADRPVAAMRPEDLWVAEAALRGTGRGRGSPAVPAPAAGVPAGAERDRRRRGRAEPSAGPATDITLAARGRPLC